MLKQWIFRWTGSISYFPLTDGTAIVTKKLQQDGTSKTTIYKPIEITKEEKEVGEFVTKTDFEEAMNKVNNDEYKNEIKQLKRQIKDLTEDLNEIMEKIKDRKD